jgi:hypothetical protein
MLIKLKILISIRRREMKKGVVIVGVKMTKKGGTLKERRRGRKALMRFLKKRKT